MCAPFGDQVSLTGELGTQLVKLVFAFNSRDAEGGCNGNGPSRNSP